MGYNQIQSHTIDLSRSRDYKYPDNPSDLVVVGSNGCVYETADFYPPQTALMAHTLTTSLDGEIQTATAEIMALVLSSANAEEK